jgi:hypothetical protein
MTPKLVKYAWKIFCGISYSYLYPMYKTLGVTLTEKDTIPESFYAGQPIPFWLKVPFTNIFIKLPFIKKYVSWKCYFFKHYDPLNEMIKDLLSEIAKNPPVAKEGDCIWSKGNNIPTYKYEHQGIMMLGSEPEAIINGWANPFWQKKVKGKLQSTGKYGLGVNVSTAIKIWNLTAQDIINLPVAD